MAFERTALGQQNRSLFLGVDRVIYVEGGRADKGFNESFDGMFWKKIITELRPDLRIRAIPKGSKNILVELAQNLDRDVSSNVLIAMDRDYDELAGLGLNKPGVIHTFGYSFENDVYHPDNLANLFSDLCPLCDDTTDIEGDVRDLIKEYVTDAWWGHFADVCGQAVGRGVISRSQPQRYLVSGNYGSRPKIAKASLAIDVYRANSGRERPPVRGVQLKKEMLPRLSVGHLYAAFCFKIMAFFHNKHSSTAKLTKDSVTSSAIQSFASFLRREGESGIKLYYNEMLASI